MSFQRCSSIYTLWWTLLLLSVLFSTSLSRIVDFRAITFLSYLITIPFLAHSLSVLTQARSNKMFLSLCLTILSLLIVAALGRYSKEPLVILGSVLVFVKFYYVIYALKNTCVIQLEKPILVILVFHLAGIGASFLEPDIFMQFKEQSGANLWGRLSGLQMNANLCALLSAVLALYYFFIKKKKFIPAILVATIILADSRSGLLLFVLSSLYISNLKSKQTAFFNGVIVLCCVYLALSFGSDRLFSTLRVIEAASNDFTFYPRLAMLTGGYRLALENFPFGAGGGTFASNLDLNPSVYSEAGIIYMLNDNLVQGIHDSGIGAVLGQFGFISVPVIVFSLFYSLKLFGAGLFAAGDNIFILTIIFAISLAFTVISDFYISFCIALIALIIKHVRMEKHQKASEIG